MRKIDILRKKYPRFIYKDFFYNFYNRNLEISFDFAITPNIFFKPKIKINNVPKVKVDKRVIENLIFHLGLIESLSYWKATCSPVIEVKAGKLSKRQTRWWRNLIEKGMGQYFYENRINFQEKGFLRIEADRNPVPADYPASVNLRNIILVPIGGGKDSVVTLEILKGSKKEIRCFSLNPTEAAKKIMKVGECKEPIIVKREIDPKLLELNQKGFLNGHTPFSAYLAFLSVLVAYLFNIKYIAFSNERSSNEENLRYLGRIINHQYSKSFDFEKRFREYTKKYLVKGIEYFSFLRPLYEIQIERLFSKYPQYLNAFLSCNEAYKTYSGTRKPIKKWCGKCPKCLFVFSSLYPFVGKKIIKIFGKNLFEDKNLLPLMLQLIGRKKFKPFECVGTKKESLVSLYLSWKKAKSERKPYLLKYFEKNVLPKYPNLEKQSEKILNSWNKNHNLNKEFETILKNEFKCFKE